MDAAAYGTYRTDDTNTLVSGFLGCHSGTGLDHSQNRNIQLIFHLIQGKSTGRITGYNNGLHLLFLQKMNDLTGVTDNRFFGFASVWNPGCVSEIYDFFRGKIPHDFPGYGQSSDTGIKHTNRCVSVYIH